MNTISLVIGDWSHDGHGKSETISIESSLSRDEVESAYQAGTKKLGFDFVMRICSQYGETSMENEIWQNFLAAGYTLNPNVEYYFEEDDDGKESDLSLSPEAFADFYLFIVKLGNPNFDGRMLPREESPTIDIGGYGLFE